MSIASSSVAANCFSAFLDGALLAFSRLTSPTIFAASIMASLSFLSTVNFSNDNQLGYFVTSKACNGWPSTEMVRMNRSPVYKKLEVIVSAMKNVLGSGSTYTIICFKPGFISIVGVLESL